MGSPDPFVVALVLVSALLHASWNALTKSGRDRLLTLWVVIGVGSLLGAVAICIVPPPAPAARPYLAGSVALHSVYHLCLLRMYRLGDLSQMYPIARGLAPMLVGMCAAYWADESLGASQAAGLALATGAICVLALASGARVYDARRAVAAAVITGVLIAAYTFVDGQGVRRAEGELGYIAWSFFLDGIPMTALVLWVRRREIPAFLRQEGLRAFLGGVIATFGYSIVLWALARGAMAQVAALRETSVLFAALIGARLLGEPFGRARLVAALGVVAGVVLLHLG